MKSHDDDPRTILERMAREIREEPVDSRMAGQAADRVWSRVSCESGETGPASSAICPAEAGTVADGPLHGCEGVRALISGFVAGTLAPARALLVEDHARECVPCRHALREARAAGEAGGREAVRPWEMPPAERTGPAGRAATGPLRWGLAVAAGLAILAAGLTALRWLPGSGGGGPLEVGTLSGSLYSVERDTLVPLASGSQVPAGAALRTARNSNAVVQLADGTRIEMAERSEIRITDAGNDTHVDLARGRIIVQAAQRGAGHLYVLTEDARVAVTGTIFSVNHGAVGSRVSVLEGEVKVDHDGHEVVLGPGGQLTTRPAVGPVPLAKEIAWSRDVDRYLALAREVTALRRDIEAHVAVPGLRFSTALLDLAPEGTLVYGAMPNIGEALSQAERRFRARVAESDVLREWWDVAGPDRKGGAPLGEIFDKVRIFGAQVGDEVALAVRATEESPGHAAIIVYARARDGKALRGLIEQEMKAAGRASEPAPGVRDLVLLPEALPATGPDSPARGRLLFWVGNGVFAASTELELIRSVAAAQENPSSNPFLSTGFHGRLAEAYKDGAGWLFGADVHALALRAGAAGGEGRPEAQAVIGRSGLLDARHLIVNVRESRDRTSTSAALTFEGDRGGVASWLAEPAPMGTLAFISPDATMLAAFLIKEPALLVEDLFGIVDSASPGFAASREEFERKSGLRIREDIAAPIGGEIAVALDGPLLPVPAWKVVLEVYDPARLQRTMAGLVEAINREHGEGGEPLLVLESSGAGDRTYHVIRQARGAGQIHYTFADGFLVAAPDRSLLERTLSSRRAGVSIASAPFFQELLPPGGRTGFSAVLYQGGGEMIGRLARTLAGAGALTPEQRRSAEEIQEDLPSRLAIIYGERDRIVLESVGQGSVLGHVATLAGLHAGAGPLVGMIGEATPADGGHERP